MKSFALLLMSMTAVLGAAPPAEGQRPPDFQLMNLDGAPRKLSETMAKGPVVLVLLRGFPGYQCPMCNRQVMEFVKNAAAFESAKAHVVLVYPGPKATVQDKAQQFVTGKNLPQHFELLLDPDYAMTNQYGLRWEAPNETAYPSTFVVDQTGVIRFAKISNSHGGRSTAAEVLAILQR